LEHELIAFVNLFVVGTTSEGDGDGPWDPVGECFHSIRNEWLLLLWVMMVNLEFKRQPYKQPWCAVFLGIVSTHSWKKYRNFIVPILSYVATYIQTIIPQGFVIKFGGMGTSSLYYEMHIHLQDFAGNKCKKVQTITF
jgi:hypothetical protein